MSSCLRTNCVHLDIVSLLDNSKDDYTLSNIVTHATRVEERPRGNAFSIDHHVDQHQFDHDSLSYTDQSRLARSKRLEINKRKQSNRKLLDSSRTSTSSKRVQRSRRKTIDDDSGGVAANDQDTNNIVSKESVASSSNRVSISNEELIYVLHKKLTLSDVGSCGRTIIPKNNSRKLLPPLEEGQSMVLEMQDLNAARIWKFKFRYWKNIKSRMYVLENTGGFVKFHGLKKGDQLTIYKHRPSERYVICAEKISPYSTMPTVETPKEVRDTKKSGACCLLNYDQGIELEANSLPTQGVTHDIEDNLYSNDEIQNLPMDIPSIRCEREIFEHHLTTYSSDYDEEQRSGRGVCWDECLYSNDEIQNLLMDIPSIRCEREISEHHLTTYNSDYDEEQRSERGFLWDGCLFN